jgi:hypothetical protein
MSDPEPIQPMQINLLYPLIVMCEPVPRQYCAVELLYFVTETREWHATIHQPPGQSPVTVKPKQIVTAEEFPELWQRIRDKMTRLGFSHALAIFDQIQAEMLDREDGINWQNDGF